MQSVTSGHKGKKHTNMEELIGFVQNEMLPVDRISMASPSCSKEDGGQDMIRQLISLCR